MIEIDVLIAKVLVLLLLMIPGFLLSKIGFIPEKFGKGLANIILYIAQPALMIVAYNCDFDMDILIRAGFVFLFSILAHTLYTVVALLVYRRAPETVKSVLQFAMIFTNAGYMGIPLIESLFAETDPNVGIYASIYCLVFNIFCWSVGSYVYSHDKKYISPRKAFLNPVVVASAVGLLLFFTPLNRWLDGNVGGEASVLLASIVKDTMVALKSLIAPLSMFLIGMRLAEIKWKGILKDRYLYPYIALRMLILPALTFCLVKLFALVGVYNDATAATVLLLSAAAPAATATGMFAELFDGNSVYAGKLVAVSTLLSIVTMPVVALLLLI